MAERRRSAAALQPGDGPQIPIRAVEKPILCSPYEEPREYWLYAADTGEATRAPGRRPAGYYYRTGPVRQQQQLSLLAEENWEELPLVNALRDDVRRWRESNYRGSTNVTRELLRHWRREGRPRRLFFCQIEAAETIIYLAEMRRGGRQTQFSPKFKDENLAMLTDQPDNPDLTPLIRYACKMATGSGKTVVMAMLIAWSFCNRGRVATDERFPSGVLVLCPNLTVKERLQVLRPDSPDNYYTAFDLVPLRLRDALARGKVLVTNWHRFAPESEHAEGGRSFAVVNKGPESPDAFARRVLEDLYGRGPLLVLNDEGHHAYRPKPLTDGQDLTREETQWLENEQEEATVWVSGLDLINQACGIKTCVDMSATPFHIQGSSYPEGSPFPWIVSDFGLVDAIESGIVKIPRLPVEDTTGRPEPRYFRLWQAINENLQPGQRLPGRGRKPRPEVVWSEAQGALETLASQYKERLDYIQQASPGQDRTPPVLIIVCDNTDIADIFYRNISGEETVDVEDDTDDDDDDDQETPQPRRRRRKRTKTLYGQGIASHLLRELFANSEGFKPTIRIDTKLLAEADLGDGRQTRQQAGAELRRIVATVGKPGEPGEHVRCVVSVSMLTEGWDANNVTHVLGLRAFTSQLLCEQVVGRGLRRMDYTPDPETGLLTEEYVDIYGIPFSVIPFKGRPKNTKAPEDKPKNHVRALPERAAYEIRFPVVEGYAFALRKPTIKADLDRMEPLAIEPNHEPTAVFVKPTVGYQTGNPTVFGSGQFEEQNREAYYRSTHIQSIKFEIARELVGRLTSVTGYEDGPHGRLQKLLQSRHQLFPQVFRLVDQFVERKVDFRGQDHCELGLQRYVDRVVERLQTAIQPDDAQGEPPLIPILNRYKPIGTTAEVNFKTVRQVHGTERSHIDQVVLDAPLWESSAAFRLDQASIQGTVAFYARNDHLEFTIPYEFTGVSHAYEPDFLVRLSNGVTVILEIKGYEDEQDKAKHDAARRWEAAVNNWGQLGRWHFHLCKDPQVLGRELAYIAENVR